MKDRAATWALVLGLLALPFAILAPFAIFAGVRSLRRRRTTRAAAGLASGVLSLTILAIVIAYWVVATA